MSVTHASEPERPAGLRRDVGAWFGSQVGATCWMAVAVPFLVPRSLPVALGVLAICALANGIGTWLWSRGDRLAVGAAYRALLVVIGSASLAAVALVHLSGHWHALELGGPVPPLAMYAVIVATVGGTWVLVRRRERMG